MNFNYSAMDERLPQPMLVRARDFFFQTMFDSLDVAWTRECAGADGGKYFLDTDKMHTATVSVRYRGGQ